MNINCPKFGSAWQHHSGRVYTVLGVANTTHLDCKYPVTVIFVGRNGNLWAKTLDNFLENLHKVAPKE